MTLTVLTGLLSSKTNQSTDQDLFYLLIYSVVVVSIMQRFRQDCKCVCLTGFCLFVPSCVMRGLDTLDRFSAPFYKGDRFCDLLAFMHNNPLLKKGLL